MLQNSIMQRTHARASYIGARVRFSHRHAGWMRRGRVFFTRALRALA